MVSTDYHTLHKRVNRLRGRPHQCEECGTTDQNRKYQWASISKNYADVNDYRRLCIPCHRRFDGITYVPPARHGEENPCSKLTVEDVLAIRERYALGGISQRALAKMFGVEKRAVASVLTARTWRYLNLPPIPGTKGRICKQGHVFDDANTRYFVNCHGLISRQCITCKRAYDLARRQARRPGAPERIDAA